MRTPRLFTPALALAALAGCQGNPTDDVHYDDDLRPEVGLELPGCPVDFGAVPLGTTHSLSLSLANTGRSDLIVHGIDVASPFSTHLTLPITLTSDSAPTLALRFVPYSYGDYDESIAVSYGLEVGELMTLHCAAKGSVIRDLDGDGYQAVGAGGDDCHDEDASVHPGAVDQPYDGIDSDCSGGSDFDQDQDGFESAIFNRDAAAGGGDCVDVDPDIRPNATDLPYDGIDSDCSGNDDFDQDGDGYRASDHGGADCDDADAAVNPDATELFDGVDNDCGGGTDDGALADDAPVILYGSTADQSSGRALATGDFDGDGLDDLVIGSPGYKFSATGPTTGDAQGGLGVFFQSSGNLVDYARPLIDADWTLEGATAMEEFGTALANLGDFDGDGRDDLAVGAPQNGSRAGAVYVFSGVDLSASTTTDEATLVLTGDDDDNLGIALSSQTDVDGDGTMDVVAWGTSTHRPEISLGIQLGGATGTVAWSDMDATFRMKCGEEGDGTTPVTCGPPVSWSAADTADLGGTDSFAWSATVGHDVDGDGYHDLVAGDQYNDDLAKQGGAAWVLWGRSEMEATEASMASMGSTLARGDGIKQRMGALATAIPDRDGDGVSEVLIHDYKGERLYLIHGGAFLRDGELDLTTAPSAVLTGVDQTLRGVTVAGDWDDDGLDELVLSLTDRLSITGGEVRMLSSAALTGTLDFDVVAPASIEGGTSNTAFGAGIDLVSGDLDGDGAIDLVVADPSYDNGLGAEGTIYVFFNSL